MASPDYVRSLPQLPGIYVFKDREGSIIYVGKAKQLRNRVSSYFRKQDDWKVQELIKEHATVEHILTKNELEALLLEAQLIRSYKPKYNVLLKYSNPFVYLMITQGDLPELQFVRQKRGKGIFFGPFLYKKRARSSYEYLMRSLKLRLCSTKIDQGCLDYHMGLCAGNCMPSFNKEDYLTRLMITQRLLEGNYEACQEMLIKQIHEHNQKLEYEKSRRLNMYLHDLASLFEALKTGFTERKYEKDITVMSTPIASKIEQPIEALFELQRILKLPERPETLDCFDISHFQSSYLVGSCIRFKEGFPDKNKFRRFKIKTLTEQNDYASLQEIVSRRYRNPDELPDVVVIDGGKGQLSAVKNLFPDTVFVSLAKREELLHTPLNPEGIPLDIKTPLGQLLIRLRDYAHHFAVSYHRVLRTNNFLPKQQRWKRKWENRYGDQNSSPKNSKNPKSS